MRRVLLGTALLALLAGAAGIALQSRSDSAQATAVTASGAAAPAVAAPAAATPIPSAKFLPLALAQRAASVALNNCTKRGFAVSVTVVGNDGINIVQLRGDGSTGATVDVSKGKAFASAGFKSPTSGLDQAAKSDPGLLTVPNFVLLAGGLPISSNGAPLGGIGVSGTPSGQIDEACAQAGLDAIAGSL
jgi:uncharacterized protein GlcG (DUF336 family)